MNQTIGKQSSDESAPKDEIFQVINQAGIQEAVAGLKEKGIEMSNVAVRITNPGDDLFDRYEVQTKLLFEKADSDWSRYIEILKSHGLDENNISVQELRELATAEGVRLEGKLPGFVITAGDDEIIFFGIKEENVLGIAQRYALKAGLSAPIDSIEEAKEYLKSLAKESLFHEAGHVAYSKLNEASRQKWALFIGKNPDTVDRVKELQRDKYSNESEIPIDDEAFADAVVRYVSDGKLGRLDVSMEGIDLLKNLVQPQ